MTNRELAKEKYMGKMYVLHHFHELKGYLRESAMFIGVFSDMETVNDVIERYCKLSGFDEYDKKHFVVDEYVTDQRYWANGFYENGIFDVPIGESYKNYENISGPNSERYAVMMSEKVKE